MSAYSGQPPLIQALLRPEAYPHPVQTVELIETHISWVLLTGAFAYKLKKPINLGFVQAATLQQRLHYCHEEVRLNRRLAASLYRGVVAVVGPVEQARVLESPNPPQGQAMLEAAVKMRQFPPDQLLSSALAHQTVRAEAVTNLAWSLGRFHQQAPGTNPEQPFGTAPQVVEPVTTNLAVLDRLVSDPVQLDQLQQHRRWTQAQHHNLWSRFEERHQDGEIRECHGDLHCGNIRLTPQGELEVFDAIDFNPNLRWIDPISEMAFLVMDLQIHNARPLAITTLNTWLECTGSYAGMDLWPWYHAYRAMVRAKVSALQMEQSTTPVTTQRLRQELALYLQTASQNEAPPTGGLVLMHGLSGSGKSTLSAQLCSSLEAVRIRSDRERRRAFEPSGLTPAAFSGDPYRAEISRWLFDQQLPKLTERCLMSGYAVIVDATFLRRRERQTMLNLAARLHRQTAIVHCSCSDITAQSRLSQRAQRGDDPSEADFKVRQQQHNWLEPLTADERLRTVTANESTPLAAVQTAVQQLLKSPLRA